MVKSILKLLFCGAFSCTCFFVFAQNDAENIYDFEHSLKYADYLTNSNQFVLAAEEYERLVFMKPEDSGLRISLLKTLRKAEKYGEGIKKWNYFQSEKSVYDKELNAEFIKMLLLADSLSLAEKKIAEKDFLESNFKKSALIYSAVLQLKSATDEDLSSIAEAEKFQFFFKKIENQKSRNPWLASAFSTIIPGSGKAYAGQWKDGFISLIFVGVNAWQTQRKFSNEGIESFWGWFHASVGTGFYIGNIYGSHKAARRFNQKQKLNLKHEAKALVFPLLD